MPLACFWSHKFEARYEIGPPDQKILEAAELQLERAINFIRTTNGGQKVRESFSPNMTHQLQLLEATRTKTYVGDVCTRCGATIHRMQM